VSCFLCYCVRVSDYFGIETAQHGSIDDRSHVVIESREYSFLGNGNLLTFQLREGGLKSRVVSPLFSIY